MAITPSPLTGIITTSAFQTELDRARDWVNDDLLAADVSAASLNETHVYRPDIFGFPKQSAEGVFQGVYEAHLNPQGNVIRNLRGTGSTSSAGSPDRISIFTANLTIDDTFRIAQSFRRVVLDSISDVEVHWSAWVDHRPSEDGPATSPAVYPATIGRLVMRYTEVGSGAYTSITGTRRKLYTQYVTTGEEDAGRPHYNAHSQIEDLPPGTYDFFLEYGLNAASLVTEQVIIDTMSILVEVHK